MTPVNSSSFDPTARVSLRTRKGTIRPRGANQQNYVRSILDHDINFGIGRAVTGGTPDKWVAKMIIGIPFK